MHVPTRTERIPLRFYLCFAQVIPLERCDSDHLVYKIKNPEKAKVEGAANDAVDATAVSVGFSSEYESGLCIVLRLIARFVDVSYKRCGFKRLMITFALHCAHQRDAVPSGNIFNNGLQFFCICRRIFLQNQRFLNGTRDAGEHWHARQDDATRMHVLLFHATKFC